MNNMDQKNQITPPFGFGPLVPLAATHKLLRSQSVPAFFAKANSIPVTIGEFEICGRDVPVVFAPAGPEGQPPTGFVPVAVHGLQMDENLLVDENGQWANDTYMPAYVRRMPFCTATVSGGGQQGRIMCVEVAALAAEDDANGVAVVDGNGEKNEQFKQAEQFVLQVEAELERTQQLCKLLSDLKVIDGFTMSAQLPDGTPLQFGGMARVNEEKLRNLNADQLRMLIERGAMRLIYAHIASIERFQMLVNRRLMRLAAQQAANPVAAAGTDAPAANDQPA
jgi:hypothetical protein